MNPNQLGRVRPWAPTWVLRHTLARKKKPNSSFGHLDSDPAPLKFSVVLFLPQIWYTRRP